MKFIVPDNTDNKGLVNPAVSDKFILKIKDSPDDEQPPEKLFSGLGLGFPIPKNPPANNPYIRMMKHYNSAMEQNSRYPIDILISEWKPTRHSLIRGILTQSCSAGVKNFTKCVFYHVQFSGVIQNIAYHRAIFTLFFYVDYYQNIQFHLIKIRFSKFCFYGTR